MRDEMMQAVVCSALSDDLAAVRVEAVARPRLRPAHVLVDVAAASINFPDILMCRGLYQHRPALPFVPGMNVAGTIAAIGADVSGFAIGDRVAGALRTGAFAELAQLPASAAQIVPEAMSLDQAAAYPSAYLTAYVSLVRRANLQPGETVLVHGGAGGVGLAAVDLAKALGADVIATASSAAKRAFLRDYGADHVLDPGIPFRDAVKDLTGGRGADVIFDPVGGDIFDQSTRCIAFDGRLLVIGFTSGRIANIATNIPLIKGFSVVGVRAGEYGRRFPERGRQNVAAIWTLAREGRVRPHVHATLPLHEFKRGFAMLTNREAIGKVVLRPQPA